MALRRLHFIDPMSLPNIPPHHGAFGRLKITAPQNALNIINLLPHPHPPKCAKYAAEYYNVLEDSINLVATVSLA